MDTRARLLDAAEELFAEKGFGDASMRELTTRAEVNLAAVGYHFGGKQQLFREVVLRRLGELCDARIARLDALESSDPAPSLRAILEAFVDPVLEIASRSRGRCFLQLVARCQGDPSGPWNSVLSEAPFERVLIRFRSALVHCMPALDPSTITWRLHLMVGSLVHVLLHADALGRISQGAIDPTDHVALRAEVVAFMEGAWNAPPVPALTERLS